MLRTLRQSLNFLQARAIFACEIGQANVVSKLLILVGLVRLGKAWYGRGSTVFTNAYTAGIAVECDTNHICTSAYTARTHSHTDRIQRVSAAALIMSSENLTL